MLGNQCLRIRLGTSSSAWGSGSKTCTTRQRCGALKLLPMLPGAGCRNNWAMLRRISSLAVVLLVCAPFLRAQIASCGPTVYDCAVFYVQHQQFREAIGVLSNLLRESPQTLRALNLL